MSLFCFAPFPRYYHLSLWKPALIINRGSVSQHLMEENWCSNLPTPGSLVKWLLICCLCAIDVYKKNNSCMSVMKICRDNDLWRLLYLHSAAHRSPDAALEALANDIGWRRLYFTSKLQLQVHVEDLEFYTKYHVSMLYVHFKLLLIPIFVHIF